MAPTRRAALSLGILGALVGEARADSTKEWITGGYLNGRFWKTLDRDAKLTYTLAYVDGLRFAYHHVVDKEERSKADQRAQAQFPGDLAVRETIESVDRFYAVPENVLIPIAEAFFFTLIEVAGAPEETIQLRLRRIRAESLASAGMPH